MTLKVGSGVDFVPDRDMIELSGKVILVTGGTGGLGKAVVLALVKKNPSKIYLTARNPSKYQDLVDEIQQEMPNTRLNEILHLLECDLGDLKTIQSAAHEVLQTPSPKLDIIICSGGVMFSSPSLTKDGYEIQFGTNHMSHALLIKLLLPLLQNSSDGRISIFTSAGFGLHPSGGILFDSLHTTQEKEIRLATRWQLYSQSKLANLLYAAELARRHPRVTSVAVHPGEIYTPGMASLGWTDRFILSAINLNKFMTPEEGSRNALWSVTAPLFKDQKKVGDVKEVGDERVDGRGFVVNGAYYEPIGAPGKHMRQSTDQDLAERLWEWTEKELEGFN
ncbi:putative oxidoreductase [Lachnellula suecica]|uniref:Putative oxidoreductase n=1 Tax=Lachnellula suecica TaxID=602035 RepID=A0A8T9CLB6_9HELO|nr:putative oxidoreductase [Lachnellula suecica]